MKAGKEPWKYPEIMKVRSKWPDKIIGSLKSKVLRSNLPA
jgi:hypothetical protein